MRAVDIIRKKRDGHPVSPDEVRWMVAGIASGEGVSVFDMDAASVSYPTFKSDMSGLLKP